MFFGADPHVIAPTQIEQHEKQLAQYLALAADSDALPAGMRSGLDFGITYSRLMIDFWKNATDGQ